MINNNVLEIIKQRRSCRDFSCQQINEEELRAILKAGSCAPFAGDQKCHFTVIQNRELLDQLNLAAKKIAVQMDIEYMRKLGNNKEYNCIYNAPTLIIISGNEKAVAPEFDSAAVTQNILIAAESLGIGACWIFFVLLAFFSSKSKQLMEKLQIPEEYKPYTSMALGYKRDTIVNIPDNEINLITYIR